MANNDNGQILILSEDYKNWVESISLRYRQCQIKAAVSVNRELILFRKQSPTGCGKLGSVKSPTTCGRFTAGRFVCCSVGAS